MRRKAPITCRRSLNLYYFAPYINPSGNNACTFNIKRGKTKLEVIIRPTIRSEVTVEIK